MALEVYALKYVERDTTACPFFYREASAFETIDALAGAERLIVAGHDPEVAERFQTVEPGIIKVA